MKLRHGFKAEAERLALETREELGLTAFDRLDPQRLAENLAIPVYSLADLRAWGVRDQSIRHLATSAPEEFSAMTIFNGTSRLIVENPAHATSRRSNSLCHELAHTLLEHEPHDVRDESGARVWSADMEGEADWLAGELLIPRTAVLQLVRDSVSIEEATARYGVSGALVQWRFNHSGARKQVERERNWRRRKSRAS